MQTLIQIRNDADRLSPEERAGLASHLLASLPSPPLGGSDAEADRRDAEMDSGEVQPISYAEFVEGVGRNRS